MKRSTPYIPPAELYGPQASILITGASSGIGEALALHLAQYGGKLALLARRSDRLHALAQRLERAGAKPLVLVGDVTDAACVERTHNELVRVQGGVDVAFLNAGIGDSFTLPAFSAARVQRVIEVNVFGVAHWLELLLPTMIERRRGTIVGISSLAAHRGFPTNGAYCASKAALSALLESVRAEARFFGIHVCTVEPGFIRSEMTARNRFPMPFLMETNRAAERIATGAARGKTVLRFPWPMAALMQLLRLIPDRYFSNLAGRQHQRHGGKALKS